MEEEKRISLHPNLPTPFFFWVWGSLNKNEIFCFRDDY
jgi:hypothetical protein